jgi:hypothetical protein
MFVADRQPVFYAPSATILGSAEVGSSLFLGTFCAERRLGMTRSLSTAWFELVNNYFAGLGSYKRCVIRLHGILIGIGLLFPEFTGTHAVFLQFSVHRARR